MYSTRTFRTAFTIVEMLVALMIMAMLMTALAAAFNASMVSFKANKDAFTVTNTARQALIRITTELRTANAVVVSEASSQCSFFTADNSPVTYKFDSTDNTLYLITNDNDYILATGVTAMTFTKGIDPTDPGVVRNVQISMTVSANNFTKTLATAAVLRRNIP